MPESVAPAPPLAESDRWSIVRRYREYDGELSANVLRVVGVLAFYTVELVNFHGVSLGPLQLPRVAGVDQRFHFAITALAVAWLAVACGVLLLLRSRVFPPVLKFLTSSADVLLLTAMLLIADGPKSTLTIGYFLVVVLAVLRFSRPLVAFTTVGAMLGYCAVAAHAHLARPWLKVMTYQEVMTLLGLALTGVVLSRTVAQAEGAASHLAAFAQQEKP